MSNKRGGFLIVWGSWEISENLISMVILINGGHGKGKILLTLPKQIKINERSKKLLNVSFDIQNLRSNM